MWRNPHSFCFLCNCSDAEGQKHEVSQENECICLSAFFIIKLKFNV
nr:MAG TPA: hypothetical protein [Caudoviricetes sp.]